MPRRQDYTISFRILLMRATLRSFESSPFIRKSSRRWQRILRLCTLLFMEPDLALFRECLRTLASSRYLLSRLRRFRMDIFQLLHTQTQRILLLGSLRLNSQKRRMQTLFLLPIRMQTDLEYTARILRPVST